MNKTPDKVFGIFIILIISAIFSLFMYLLVKSDRYDKLTNDVDFAACVYAQDFDSFHFSYDKEIGAWRAEIEKDWNARSITWSDDETVQAIVLKTYCK